MSALARYFKAKGYKVAGYDRTLSALTQKCRLKKKSGLIILMKRKRFRLNSGIKRRRWWYILRRYPGITGNGLISQGRVSICINGRRSGYDFPERKGDLCSRYTWENDGIYADCPFVKKIQPQDVMLFWAEQRRILELIYCWIVILRISLSKQMNSTVRFYI